MAMMKVGMNWAFKQCVPDSHLASAQPPFDWPTAFLFTALRHWDCDRDQSP